MVLEKLTTPENLFIQLLSSTELYRRCLAAVLPGLADLSIHRIQERTPSTWGRFPSIAHIYRLCCCQLLWLLLRIHTSGAIASAVRSVSQVSSVTSVHRSFGAYVQAHAVMVY